MYLPVDLSEPTSSADSETSHRSVSRAFAALFLVTFLISSAHGEAASNRDAAMNNAGKSSSAVISTGKAQANFDVSPSSKFEKQRASLEARTSELVCEFSSFFSVDPEEVLRSRAHLEGRGLVTCKNAQGFTTELPVRAEIEATLPANFDRESEFSFSANSAPFVIPREVNELQDSFLISPPIATSTDSSDAAADAPSLLLRGLRHDLVISLRLNSQKSHLNGLKVATLDLKFDDEAPDLY